MRKNENKRDNSLSSNVIDVFEQHSRDFIHQSDILDNANAGGTVAFKSTWKLLNENIFYYSVLKSFWGMLLELEYTMKNGAVH